MAASCLPAQILLWVAGMMKTGDVISELRAAPPGLREQWPIRSLGLFGSRVRDDATRDSDLDGRFVEGMTLDGYRADEKTRYALMRGYKILGEAVRHLPASLKAANSDIPWSSRRCCLALRHWHVRMAWS